MTLGIAAFRTGVDEEVMKEHRFAGASVDRTALRTNLGHARALSVPQLGFSVETSGERWSLVSRVDVDA